MFLDGKGPFKEQAVILRDVSISKLGSALVATWVIKTKTICYIICCISSHHNHSALPVVSISKRPGGKHSRNGLSLPTRTVSPFYLCIPAKAGNSIMVIMFRVFRDSCPLAVINSHIQFS